ncbi:MAG: Brp/Blh family beta-carotene 15,15'-dioxygenase [Verrucomicrobiota bacterium]
MESPLQRPIEHFVLPWLGAALLAGLCLLMPAAMKAAQMWILGAVFLLAVAPHVAVDPWLPAWERDRPFIFGEWVRMVAAFVLGAAAILVLGWALPFWTLILFLVMTLVHWGCSDGLAALPWTRDALALGVARGTLLLHLPVVFAPLEVTALLTLLPLAGEETLLLGWLRHAPLIVVACLLAEVLVLLFPSRPLPGHWRALSLLHLVETGVLLGLFLAAPPLLAVAAYFTFFHHWRYVQEVGRLQARGRRQAEPNPGEAVARFAQAAAPLSLVLIAAAMAAFFALMAGGVGSRQLLGATVWALAMLTPAHLVLGLWLQTRQPSPVSPGLSGPADQNLPPLQRGLRRILGKK